MRESESKVAYLSIVATTVETGYTVTDYEVNSAMNCYVKVLICSSKVTYAVLR